MSVHKSLVVPGLFPALPDSAVPAVPALEKAWSQGDREVFERPLTLAQWPPNQETTWESARRAQAAGIFHAAPHWLCADPVHLHVVGDGLILLDDYTFELSAEESRGLREDLNAHFAMDGLYFHEVTPTRWLLGLPSLPEIETPPPRQRVGRNIDGPLPRRPQRGLWQARFNEIQMVLHDHPHNQARQAQGRRVISGVWLWDEACTQSAQEVVETLRAPSDYGDAEGWMAALEEFLETHWQYWQDQLRQGTLETLTLVALEGRCSGQVVLRHSQRWRFWRKVLPLMGMPGVRPLRES
jgi:hypothetical protein